MSRPFAPTTLMLGNFVTGATIIAPAAMLGELATGLGVSIVEAGLLITFGAIVLGIASPVTAWLTSRIERRALLTAAIAVMAVGNAASALAPNYATLMAIRLVMLAVAALYTPQAAGTVGMIVPVEKRGGAISYLFLGWSLAAAAGLPLTTIIADRFGWRTAFACIALIAAVVFVLVLWRLPKGLRGTPVDLKTWIAVGQNRLVLLLLLVTLLQMSGQFTVFTFIGPLLQRLTGASPDAIGLAFAAYGVCGFLGNLAASRLVDTWGGYRTSLLFTSLLLIGVAGWALGAGIYLAMLVGVAVWGLGFASTNSMQQARLFGAAPPLAPVTVSLNTSVLYVGQAIGSAIGGALYAREMYVASGYVAAGLVLLALIVVISTRRMQSTVA